MNDFPKNTVALYARVSTDEQATQGFSIDNQKERLIAYCASQGWDDYRLYVDDGYTGTNMDRPALQRIIQHAKDKRIDTVVVYKLDRLGRKQKDVLFLLEDVFDKHGVTFKSATEPFDTSTPLGKAMLGILAVFAQLERDTIVERTTSGRRQRIRRGMWYGGRRPFGYEWVRETQQLIVVPEQAELVKEIYRRYLQGRSLSELADWIAERTSDRKTSHVLIRDMLDRPIYVGQLSTGTGDLVHGNHEAIIDPETWSKVQHERRRRREGMTPSGNYLLSGLCQCGLCGGSVIHIPRHSRDYTYQFYCCKDQHVRRRDRKGQDFCRLGYLRQEKLEEVVITKLRQSAFRSDLVMQEIENERQSDDELQPIRESVEQAFRDVESRLDRWYDLFEEGGMNTSQLKSRIAGLEEEKKKLQFRLDELEPIRKEDRSEELLNTLQVIQAAWDELDFDERQMVLRDAVAKIIVRPKYEVEFIWNS